MTQTWRNYRVECFKPRADPLIVTAPSFGVAIEFYCVTRGLLGYEYIICVPTLELEPAVVYNNNSQVEAPTEGTREDVLRLIPEAENPEFCMNLDAHHRPVSVQFGDWREYAFCLKEIRKGLLYLVAQGPELLVGPAIGQGAGELVDLQGKSLAEPRLFFAVPSRLNRVLDLFAAADADLDSFTA